MCDAVSGGCLLPCCDKRADLEWEHHATSSLGYDCSIYRCSAQIVVLILLLRVVDLIKTLDQRSDFKGHLPC